eukprot:Nitzschia sp. Nitz4//scaffold429_size8240//816//2594//NITZ4_009135-RA/size8240-processed-gene-0.8-mRNA-1//-1//CDS//3329551642//8040//frame0
MSCCCGGSKAKDGANGHQGLAPQRQIMDDDERAVEWWRTHQDNKGGDENLAPQGFENSKSRMQQRNPLAKPYDLSSREKPLHPQDGDVLQPALAHVNTGAQGRICLRENAPLQLYEPEEVASTTAATQERLTIIATDVASSVASSQIEQADYSLVTLPHKTALSSSESMNFDHLSDVSSEVDSIAKKRYLLACQMLKKTMTNKEKVMAPLEREFILSLLGDYDNMDAVSTISEDQVSAIEHAALRLENDPLFQPEEPGPPPPSPLAAASMQRESEPTTTTSKMTIRRLLANSCLPQTPRPTNASADVVYTATVKSRMSDSDQCNDQQEVWRDQYLDPSNEEEGEGRLMVRFDGWSLQRSEEYPFDILGADGDELESHVLTPSTMEALRGFFPYAVTESNFWLKFSLMREGASLPTLLSTVRASTYTVIAVETRHGEVFGCFTGTPWRTGSRWFGTGEAFLWRLKQSRMTSQSKAKASNVGNEMEVYPFTGLDDLVQYCTSKTIAVGGGDWTNASCPFPNEPCGIGFMIDGDLAGGETNSCATFANPRLCKKASASNEFTIENLEVWTLTPCRTVEEAAKLEVQKMFVKENFR